MTYEEKLRLHKEKEKGLILMVIGAVFIVIGILEIAFFIELARSMY